ncbi:pentatricopeptide repeat (PPR) superfamily protein [Wolffia australiana]
MWMMYQVYGIQYPDILDLASVSSDKQTSVPVSIYSANVIGLLLMSSSPSSSSSYADLLSSAREARSLGQLKQIHAQALLRSFHGRPNQWLSFLLAQCHRLRSPRAYARRLFASISRPDSRSFTSILRFHSLLGDRDEVRALISQMLDLGLPADAFVIPILIKNSAPTAIDPIHGYVVKLGHFADQYIRNAILDGYAKRGDISLARDLFDESPCKTPADWNAILSGYWACGKEDEALRVFEAMPARNAISFTAMVTGYCRIGQIDKAKNLFDEMPERTVVSWNAMISGYVQNRQPELALRLFEEMIAAGADPDETTFVTVFSACSSRGDRSIAENLVAMLERRGLNRSPFVKTALIDMLAKCGNLHTAREIFDAMGAARNSVSWNAMISAYCREGDLAMARQLFDEMPRRNTISWNSMISGYVQNGQWGGALKLFKAMEEEEEEAKPDEITMVSVLSACGHLGARETGQQAIKTISRVHIKLTISGHNAMVFMHSRCGNLAEARRVFEEMPERDVISYNSLLLGLAAHGSAVEAAALLQRMKENNIEPDKVTFLGVLSACSHGGATEIGKQVFRAIESPAIDHLAAMVDLLGRAGELDEAVKLVEESSMVPHAGVYGALLNAGRVHRRVDVAEKAAEKLFAIEEENPGNYVLLANVYAAGRRWREAEMVQEKMRRKKVKKTMGCSWVEVGGEIHCFAAGDRRHDRTREIYQLLEEYGEKMRGLGYVGDGGWSLRDVEEEEREGSLGVHSERLAVGFILLVDGGSAEAIRVVKNLRICGDCHLFMKFMSKISGREIVVRDNNRFHCFSNGLCSCSDYW